MILFQSILTLNATIPQVLSCYLTKFIFEFSYGWIVSFAKLYLCSCNTSRNTIHLFHWVIYKLMYIMYVVDLTISS